MTAPDFISIPEDEFDPDCRETSYIRRDPAVLAALPEVQALVAAAVMAAAGLCAKAARYRQEQLDGPDHGRDQAVRWTAGKVQAELLETEIRALITHDAKAAFDAHTAREVARLREALRMAKQHMIVNDLSLPNVFAVIDAALKGDTQ